MNVEGDLAKISASLEKLQGEITRSLPHAKNAAVRQRLHTLAAQIAEGRGTFIEQYQQTMAAANQQIEQSKKHSEEVLTRVAAAQERLKAPAKPPLALASKPPFAVDTSLGQRLRQELLDRFLPHSDEADAAAWKSSHEVWDDWVGWATV